MNEQPTHFISRRSIINIVISFAVILIAYLNYSEAPLQSGSLLLIWFGILIIEVTNINKYIVSAIWGVTTATGGLFLYVSGTSDVWLVGLGTGIGIFIFFFSLYKI